MTPPRAGDPGASPASAPLLRRVADGEALARAAAAEVVDAAARAIAARGRFTVALAGGSTPRRLYQLLADPAAPYRAKVAWERVHVFFGDERPVPPDHPDSNYRMAREALLAHVPAASVHRMRGELPDAAEAARGYQAELERAFGRTAAAGPPPDLDLVLLGLGPDGHTASLFPGSPALDERSAWVAAPFVPQQRSHRLTLTLPVLDQARQVLFLVAGAEKAGALRRVLAPAPGEPLLPAARVRPVDGAVLWLADEAAAGGAGYAG